MAVARHGRGPRAVGTALASQVHPVFMLPPLATALFGALLAHRRGAPFDPVAAALHVTAVFLAVYVAHVKDGYVDFHRRGEDDDHPLTVGGCHVALGVATAAFVAVGGALWSVAGAGAALLTLPTWLLGYLHAPWLDTNPLTTTAGYPVGIACCLLGGHHAQAGAGAPVALAYAAVFLFVLAGVKVVDDAQDHDYDRSIDKRTVAVVLGLGRARGAAVALGWAGGVVLLWATVGGLLPPAAPLALVPVALVALVARRKPARVATMLLVRATYLLLAVLVLVEWFRPLAGASLPDVGVLGPYTYLATEVAFGSVALALLRRAGAVRRALVTVVVLYPVAYVWDWYTLAVGVFAVRLRTGVEFAGIPVEEHLFAVVVPLLVLAVHETVHGAVHAAGAGDASG